MRRKAPLTGSRCGQCSPLFWRLLYSVLKKAFWCTEWTCGVKTGLLRYATRFQRLSVQKTGSCGTEGIFGTRNPLLRYATHLRGTTVLVYAAKMDDARPFKRKILRHQPIHLLWRGPCQLYRSGWVCKTNCYWWEKPSTCYRRHFLCVTRWRLFRL